MTSKTERYNRTAIWIHWIVAILIIFLLFPGEEFIQVPRGNSMAAWQPTAHASLGISVLLLSLFRIYWRLTHTAPALPVGMPRWQVLASHASHGLFYVLMIGLPLTGWLALQPYGAVRLDAEAVSFFRLFSLYGGLPNLGGWTMDAHEILGKVTIALLVLHVVAALKHQFWDKDGLLRRMSPH
jgi:cytochrome b561